MAPKICVTVAVSNPKKLAKDVIQALKNSDFVEIRLDFLKPNQIPACLAEIRNHLSRCVCTLRPASEGGKFQGSENERVSILKLIAEFEPYLLDIEFNTLRKNKKLQRYLKKAGTDVLVSWHDFVKTPDENFLKSLVEKMSFLSKNIKIVTTARTICDAIRILSLYKNITKKVSLISFAMGDNGRISRILCIRFGSPFTYASIGRPVASGQLSFNEMKSIFNLEKVEK